ILAAGATAQGISPRAVCQLGNVFQCTISRIHPLKQYNNYGCYCGLRSLGTPVDECCWTWDNCYNQAKDVESCKLLIGIPYTISYIFSCRDKNNTCEDNICNCD
ncbi:Phospholipase A2, partial [Cricetulus griseus]